MGFPLSAVTEIPHFLYNSKIGLSPQSRGENGESAEKKRKSAEKKIVGVSPRGLRCLRFSAVRIKFSIPGAALVGGGNFHVLAVFGYGAAGDIDAFAFEERRDLF